MGELMGVVVVVMAFGLLVACMVGGVVSFIHDFVF